MQDLIETTNGESFVSTLTIAAQEGLPEHASIIKLVRTNLEDFELFGRVGFEIQSFQTAGGVQQREYALLSERQATLLFTYMRNSDPVRAFKIRLVQEFYELARKMHTPPPPLLPAQIGETTVECMMRVALKYGTPPSYAMQVAATEATRQTGMPWDRLLTQAACMNDVPQEDIMLEPTELGKLFELSAAAMNKKLAELGLQVKTAGQWVPTEAGGRISKQHAWTKHGKSGYNLKWLAKEIEKMVTDS